MMEPELSAEKTSTRASGARADASQQSRDAEFSAYYRSDIGALINFLIWQGAKPWDSADCAQEAMIKVHAYWETIANPHAWVRRTASRSWGQRMGRVREFVSDSVPERSALLRDDAGIEAAVQRHDVLRRLEALPLRQRQVLAWTMDGYAAPEIAVELGISADAVRSSLLKARRAMTRDLRRGDGSDD
jgi:RNA polymerase sigma factor (sigma-70 family)